MTTKTPSRRSLLASAAAVSAAGSATAAMAGGVDPIFALIEAHKRADAAGDLAFAARAELEAPYLAAGRGLGLPGTERYRRWEADAPLQAATKRARRALHAEVEAFNDILRAVPTATSAGFRAFALYACELTEAIDGPPIGDALPAYRALAAFAGLPCILLPEEA